MKYSDDSEEHQKANIGYANERWRQLYEVKNDWGTEGIKYLLFVNSGAAVAMLAFIGSVGEARKLSWPIAMLAFFTMGMMMIGILHVLRYSHVSKIFKKWRESVIEYYTDQKGWSEIVDADVARSARFDWALFMAYASFACFSVGISIGLLNFSTLAIGGRNDKEETTIACTQVINCLTPQVNRDKRFGGGEIYQGDTKHPASSTDSKKEIAPK